jgi:hypothetical protein
MSETMSESTEMAEGVVESRYLSAGANRYAAAADWGEDGLVAFGSDANVCLWDPTVSFLSSCLPTPPELRTFTDYSLSRAQEAFLVFSVDTRLTFGP